MTVETCNAGIALRPRQLTLTRTARLADRIEPSWQSTIERLRALRRLPGRKPGAYALHETIAAARPALLASLQRALGGTLLVVVPTPDAAERAFADLLYYLGERTDRVALLRSRDEAIGAIESPSERSARMTLLADLADGAARIVLAPIAAVRQHVDAARAIRRVALRPAHRRRSRLGAPPAAALRARLRAPRRRQRRRRVRGARRHRRRLCGDRRRSGAHRVLRRRHRVDARVCDRIAAQQRGGRFTRRRTVERRSRRRRHALRLSPGRRDGRARRAGDDCGRREALDEERARERHTLLADEAESAALLAESVRAARIAGRCRRADRAARDARPPGRDRRRCFVARLGAAGARFVRLRVPSGRAFQPADRALLRGAARMERERRDRLHRQRRGFADGRPAASGRR